jgi:hypothetical protein
MISAEGTRGRRSCFPPVDLAQSHRFPQTQTTRNGAVVEGPKRLATASFRTRAEDAEESGIPREPGEFLTTDESNGTPANGVRAFRGTSYWKLL